MPVFYSNILILSGFISLSILTVFRIFDKIDVTFGENCANKGYINREVPGG
jgi:hypothetical protein